MKELLTYVLAIACLMLANTVIVSAEKIINKEFDFKVFFKGILRYLLILVGVLMIFFAGTLLPDIEIGEGLTLISMLKMLAVAIAIKYGVSCYNNLKSIFEIDLNYED